MIYTSKYQSYKFREQRFYAWNCFHKYCFVNRIDNINTQAIELVKKMLKYEIKKQKVSKKF